MAMASLRFAYMRVIADRIRGSARCVPRLGFSRDPSYPRQLRVSHRRGRLVTRPGRAGQLFPSVQTMTAP